MWFSYFDLDSERFYSQLTIQKTKMRKGNASLGRAIMKYEIENPGMYEMRRVDVHVSSAKKAGSTL